MSAKCSDADVIKAYEETKNVWRAGEMLGISGQGVARRLKGLGITATGNGRPWTESDSEVLRREYLIHRDAGQLVLLAGRLGRTRHFICRQARALGLTDVKHGRRYGAVWKYMEEPVAAGIFAAFKASSLGLGKFCKKHGYDDLGFARAMKRFFADEWEHVIEAKVPKQSMYRVGRAFEYRTRDYLKSIGYIVMRSPGSRSPVDLVAIKRGGVLLVQCKRGGALPVGEWNALYRMATSSGSVPVMARMPEASTRGIEFFLMTGEKSGLRKAQPMVPFDPAVQPYPEPEACNWVDAVEQEEARKP
jgi:Holliday junction resolvase